MVMEQKRGRHCSTSAMKLYRLRYRPAHMKKQKERTRKSPSCSPMRLPHGPGGDTFPNEQNHWLPYPMNNTVPFMCFISSRGMQRSWEFAVALLLIQLSSSSLRLVSAYGLVDNFVRVAFGGSLPIVKAETEDDAICVSVGPWFRNIEGQISLLPPSFSHRGNNMKLFKHVQNSFTHRRCIASGTRNFLLLQNACIAVSAACAAALLGFKEELGQLGSGLGPPKGAGKICPLQWAICHRSICHRNFHYFHSAAEQSSAHLLWSCDGENQGGWVGDVVLACPQLLWNCLLPYAESLLNHKPRKRGEMTVSHPSAEAAHAASMWACSNKL
eukprot:1145335-Pelagomonas_calceolata.AAC.5